MFVEESIDVIDINLYLSTKVAKLSIIFQTVKVKPKDLSDTCGINNVVIEPPRAEISEFFLDVQDIAFRNTRVEGFYLIYVQSKIHWSPRMTVIYS